MKQLELRMAAVLCLVTGVFITAGLAQSLTDKLKEEDKFYVNFGKELYSKLKIEKDVVGLYDMFGEHIVDGVNLYELSSTDTVLSNEREGVSDSVKVSNAKEYQKRDFYEKFSNLVVTQDAIGGLKTSFLIGDQITTKFTPLTFNKVNFKGIRWDLWSSGLQLSAVLSRTRPGFLSKKEWDGTGSALINYPITDAPDDMNSNYYADGIRGDRDFTNKSTYGDYDFLWALHAEQRLANKVDLGLTLINHHINDVKRGWHPYKGNLPDSLMPSSIHFEFYDLTSDDTLDAGVFVDTVDMYVNGTDEGHRVEAKDAYRGLFQRAFTGDQDNILLPRSIPLARPQTGAVPVMVEFKVDPQYWQFASSNTSLGSLKEVKSVSFKYRVAGNYLVFVSTDRQIPVAIKGIYNTQTQKTEYSYPTRSVGDIYNVGLKVDAGENAPIYSAERYYSTTYFGEYIAQSARKISLPFSDFIGACENGASGIHDNPEKYNYRTYTYEFNVNVSSVTYGVNFKGELGGINIAGEVAVNQSEDMLPGSEESRKQSWKWVGTLKADRELGKNFGLSAEGYYISPKWATNLRNFQASRYFNQTQYHQLTNVNGGTTLYPHQYVDDYSSPPKPLDHSWNNIDDNDDNDAFVESDRRRYPSDLDAYNDRYNFYKDGSLMWESGKIRALELPSHMWISYDDPDGVVSSKNDKNKNAIQDYREDFLLFASDPPVFELGIDLNNNGIPDYEDDDILPDFGHSVGYVITADGVLTQGIQGGSANLRYTPVENTIFDVGVIYEMAVDHDLMDSTSVVDEKMGDDLDGQSLVGYLTAKHDVIKRSQGLQYNLGAELRGIRDALRNDAVISDFTRLTEDYVVSYSFYNDYLPYRQAAVGNIVGGITYNNVRNFEYGFRFKAGAEQHIGMGDKVFYDPNPYGIDWKPYYDRTIADINFVNRVQYRIKFASEYEEGDWRSIFNFLNRLEIIPQYKLAYSNKSEIKGPPESQFDPRANLRQSLEMDKDGSGDIDTLLDIGVYGDSLNAMKSRWKIYERGHQSYLLNVPILKANYKIAENTAFQLGLQWLRSLDFISPEENSMKFTTLAQIVSKANYKGYSVTFFLGAKWFNSHWDVNERDPVLGKGSQYDMKGYEFFAKLFSGI